jgi:hypothetical protein
MREPWHRRRVLGNDRYAFIASDRDLEERPHGEHDELVSVSPISIVELMCRA